MEKEQKKDNNWAEMSDEAEEEQPAENQEKQHVIKPAAEKKKVPPPQKGSKNKDGDYVVTTIDIPDIRSGVKQNDDGAAQEEESDSDTGYDDEDDVNETPAQEVVEGKFQDYYQISNCKCALVFSI